VYTAYWLLCRTCQQAEAWQKSARAFIESGLGQPKGGRHCSIPRLCPHPLAHLYHGLLYCIASSHRRRLPACQPASCTPMQPSCARPAGAQCSCRCTAHRLGDPSTPQSAPRLFNGAAQLTQAVQPLAPLHRSGYGCIWISSWISSAGLQLLNEPARAWPQGATWLYWLARASSLSRRRLSPSQLQPAPVGARVGPFNAARQPNRGVLTAARPAAVLLPPPSAPPQDWWRPARCHRHRHRRSPRHKARCPHGCHKLSAPPTLPACTPPATIDTDTDI
jgi:hypothetical protein